MVERPTDQVKDLAKLKYSMAHARFGGMSMELAEEATVTGWGRRQCRSAIDKAQSPQQNTCH